MLVYVWWHPFWSKRKCKQAKLPYMERIKFRNNPRDGTSPRTSHRVWRSFIKEYYRVILLWRKRKFEYKLMSRSGLTFRWLPRSPDLIAPDFFYGVMSSKMYKTKPRNLTELRQSIKSIIEAIPTSTLQGAMSNFHIRCRICVADYGGYLRSIIFTNN